MPKNPKSDAKNAISGWGRTPIIQTHLQRPESLNAITKVLQETNSAIARGAGRGYGDLAASPSGTTVLTKCLDRMLSFDDKTGILTSEPGVTLAEVLDVFVPRGWFLPVTPGTKYTTLGGAVACDVHGKNHHCSGSFSNFVNRLILILASGERVNCSRSENPDLYWATLGGLGLTGVIVEIELQLIPIETAYISMLCLKSKNLDETLALYDKYESQHQYSVAWVDCLASNNSLGRGILYFGNHALRNELPDSLKQDPLLINKRRQIKVPFEFPSGLLNPLTTAIFNYFYYHLIPTYYNLIYSASPQTKQNRIIIDYNEFFYPLDKIIDWNKIYGNSGFIQYQCVFPLDTGKEGIKKILSLSSSQGRGSFLAVLKKFGKANGNEFLSFPMPGYTLALDMPCSKGLDEFLNKLDDLVLELGGRVYLAKDARLSADKFRKMYPKFSDWLAVKNRIDPENRFSSSLSERLRMHLP